MEECKGAVETFQLENGLTCYVLQKAGGGSGMSVCLVVKAGTVHETQGEYGWFHFLEHLLIYPALYGCADEQNGEGRFSAFDYAYTSFAETAFWFYGADETGELLIDSIRTAKGILEGRYLTEEAFHCTREDVLREYQDFAQKSWFPFCSAQLKEQGVCMPVGEREDILRADYDQLLRRHQQSYRMENAALIVAASKGVRELRTLVENIFGVPFVWSSLPRSAHAHIRPGVQARREELGSDLYLAWLPREILPVPELLRNYMELAMVARAIEIASLWVDGVERAECEVEIFSKEAYLLRLTVRGAPMRPLRQREKGFSTVLFEQARKAVAKQLAMQYDKRYSSYRDKERIDSCREHFLYGEPLFEADNEYEMCLSYLRGLAYEAIKEKFDIAATQFEGGWRGCGYEKEQLV